MKHLTRALLVAGAALLSLGATAGSCSPSGARWTPRVGETWQYQLDGPINTAVAAAVFDVDGYDTPASVVANLHSRRKHVICYLSAGSWENWRPDAGRFPARVLGATNGWPGERWLDIRQIAILRPIMAARFDMCRAKGFDAVEPDNVDGYANSTGYPITAAHQIAYNKMLAALAHQRGLKVGLKNDVEQARALVSSFDFAVNEQCFQYSECSLVSPFIAAHKPVFNVEYQGSAAAVCPKARALRFSSIVKRQALDASRTGC